MSSCLLMEPLLKMFSVHGNTPGSCSSFSPEEKVSGLWNSQLWQSDWSVQPPRRRVPRRVFTHAKPSVPPSGHPTPRPEIKPTIYKSRRDGRDYNPTTFWSFSFITSLYNVKDLWEYSLVVRVLCFLSFQFYAAKMYKKQQQVIFSNC